MLMKVDGDAGDDLDGCLNAFSGEVGTTQHLFEAWETRPATEIAREYGDDAIEWALVVEGRWAGTERLTDQGLTVVLAREAAPSGDTPLVLLADDLTAVQNGDQITVEALEGGQATVRLDHVDGLSTRLKCGVATPS